MYNIVYFHGLDSSLSYEKRQILNRYGKVTAPTFNYRDPEVLKAIPDLFDDLDMNNTVVIGSSFGGYQANLFSLGFDMPCLLFNPALAFRSIDVNTENSFDAKIKSLSYVVLGKKDEVINCEENLAFINEHFTGPKKLVIENKLGHRIPVDIFKMHVAKFFKILGKNGN